MSAARSLRVAVTGCGRIARGVHLPLLASSADFQLIAVAESEDQARAGLHLPDSVSRHSSLEALLDAQGQALDAVFVCTPPTDHRHALETILATNTVGAYVEKPWAASVADAEAMAEAADRAQVVVTVGHNYRFEPGVVALQRRLGEPGRPAPSWLHTRFTTARRELPSWKRRRETGGGTLLDLGSHHLDLLHLLIGRGALTGREPVAVTATLASRVTEGDLATVAVDWGDGLLSSSLFAFGGEDRDRIEVGDDAGTLALDRLRSPRVLETPAHHRGENLRRVLHGARRLLDDGLTLARLRRHDPLASYRRALAAFAGALRGEAANDTPGATPADGLRVMRTIEAAERSARERRSVPLTGT